MKIDLVYLWVDGSDPAWQKKKNAALAASARPLTAFATRPKKFMENGELKYSLRSALKFAPWINHIYIVTDAQCPAWLAAHPRVTIVDHSVILPKAALPSFNSNAKELFLWKIPGLSEHFLYANDDMFFGADVSPDFFFDANGNPIVIVKERNQAAAFRTHYAPRDGRHRMFFHKIQTAVNLVWKTFGKKYNIAFKHAIEPMRKAYLRENFEQFEDLFLKTTATSFREYTNIQRIVFPALDNAKGRNTLVLNWRLALPQKICDFLGTPGGTRRIVYHPNDSWVRRAGHSILWVIAMIFGLSKYDCYDKQAGLIKHIKKYRPSLFAINEFAHDGDAFAHASELMNEMFPKKSEFEK